MDVLSDEDENCWFFDAIEDTENLQEVDFVRNSQFVENLEYDLWTRPLQSVNERRMKFIKLMGFTSVASKEEASVNSQECTSSTGDESTSSSLPISHSNIYENEDVRGHSYNGVPEVERITGFSERAVEICSVAPRIKDQFKGKWLHKWHSITSMVMNKVKHHSVSLNSYDQVQTTPVKRVRARHFRKKLKELSALFTGRDIQAHDGSILSMKFSHDGQYLASAGEDKFVKVWQVLEDERSDLMDIPDADPSCVYFTMNHLSELGPLMFEKDDPQKIRSLRKTQDSACVIFPQKFFRILEEPLHVFRGHDGAILDLSWSKNNCLLSSSVDKTVRLWKVGVDHCLKVFSHTDYVTCIQFNPVYEDYFVSGSIDGKVRIWSINGCQVVFWTETKDIISAVSYSPDGKGGVFGSISGCCRFFSVTDNHFQFESYVCLTSKRRSPCKRITGFQFLPHDPRKVLVTCADSQIRIIEGANVIAKYKGLRNAGCCLSASFTRNGKHIISASEDSNVYFWNYMKQEDAPFSQTKIVHSFEFLPCDASIAVAWPGLNCCSTSFKIPISKLPFSGSGFFSLSQGSATWPEEKLPFSSPKMVNTSLLGKSQYRLFKTSCQSSSGTHACGLIFVTASLDGRIRSFHNYGLPVPL